MQTLYGMSAYRNSLRVACLLCGIASPLAAQGGGQARHAVAVSSAEATEAARPALEPARSILRHLVGRWRVEIRFAGNFDGPPDASATRVVDTLFDDLRLQWTEVDDLSQTQSQGMIGFDTRSGRFYGSAVNSAGSGAEFMTGSLDLAEPVVTFTAIAPTPGAGPQPNQSFALNMLDPDHFTWVPLDRAWRALLTRVR